MAHYVGNAETITVTAAKNLEAGEPVKVADNFYGIPHCPAVSGGLVALQVEGVYEFVAGANVSAGATVYVTSSGTVNVTSAAGTAIGKNLVAVTSGGIAKVLLNR
ncbi:MAG: DUF2190 family protein [Victivallales bacterium]|nr:DUF2190 family protein [Victivallales bacterium]